MNICIKHTSYNSVHLDLRWRYWLRIRPQEALRYKLTCIHKGTSCCMSWAGTLVRIRYIHTLHNRSCLSHNPWDTPESSTWTHQDTFHLKKKMNKQLFTYKRWSVNSQVKFIFIVSSRKISKWLLNSNLVFFYLQRLLMLQVVQKPQTLFLKI